MDLSIKTCATTESSSCDTFQYSIDLPIARRQKDDAEGEANSLYVDEYRFEIASEMFVGINSYAAKVARSNTEILLHTFAILLYRYSNQNNIAIGCPTDDGNATFHLWIDEQSTFKSTFLGERPFSYAVNHNESVDLSDYSILFRKRSKQSQNMARANGTTAYPAEQIPLMSAVLGETCDALLALDVVEHQDGLACSFEYRTRHFDRDAIQAFTEHFLVLLTAALKDTDTVIAELPLLTATERQEILFEWNNTETSLPSQPLIHRLVEAQATKTPHKIAVQYAHSSFTYAELGEKAADLALYLQDQGVQPGSLVGLYIERSLSMMVGLLGILKAGCCYVPLDPAFPTERLSYMIEDAKIAFLLTEASLAQTLGAESKADRGLAFPLEKTLCLDSEWSQIEAHMSHRSVSAVEYVHQLDTQPDELAYVIYTSGSTGRPKGVQIPHRAAVNFLLTMAQRPGMDAQDTLLAVTTLSFDIALLELMLPLTVGASVVIASRDEAMDARLLMPLLANEKISVLQATPATWRMLLDAGWKGKKGLRVLCGGEPFPVDLAQQLLECTDAVWNMYGPTETTVWSTIHKVESAVAPISIGRPIANTEIYILDNNLKPVPIGVPGVLYIGGLGLAKGYLNRPELTAEKFIPHPFQSNSDARIYNTGDMARYLSDGTIECLGRIDHQVKIRGFRIELGEIESCLSKHPDILQSVVVAVEEGPGNKVLVAYSKAKSAALHAADGAESRATLSPQSLRTFLTELLPDYMIPSAFVFLDEFPLTPNGKIDRKALPAPESKLRSSAEESVPRTKLEATLQKLWTESVSNRAIGIHDNFFDSGGTSLTAVRYFTQIEQSLGKRLPLSALLDAPTIAELATLLESDGDVPLLRPLVKMKQGTDPTRPPIFLCHGAGGAILLYRALAQQLPPEQTVYGIQAIGLDARNTPHQTIEEMVDHYLPEIKAIQPHGPYLLCGYCMGGTIVFEMAQRLIASGEQVGLLALLETYNWLNGSAANGGESRKEKLVHTFEKFDFHLRNLLLSDSHGKKLFFQEKYEELARRFRMYVKRVNLQISVQNRQDKTTNLPQSTDNEKQIEIGDGRAFATTSRVWETNDEASLRYQPKPYPGRIVHIVTRKEYSCYANPEMMWDEIAEGGVDRVALNVYPAGMLVEPFVAELAATLNERIRNALAKEALLNQSDECFVDAYDSSIDQFDNLIVQEPTVDAHHIAA